MYPSLQEMLNAMQEPALYALTMLSSLYCNDADPPLPLLHAGAVNNELDRWTRLLLQTSESAPYIDVTSGGRYYQLPDQLTQPVYVRRCYKRIYVKLIACDIELEVLHGLVLTGTPGIGKSVFAVYIIWRLALAKQIVYYQYKLPGGEVETYRWDFRDPANVTAELVLDVKTGNLLIARPYSCS